MSVPEDKAWLQSVFESARRIATAKPVRITLDNVRKPLPTMSICLAIDVCRFLNKLEAKIREDVRRCRNYVDSLGDNRHYEKRLIANRIGAVAATIKSAAFFFDAVDSDFFRACEYEAVSGFYAAVCFAESEMESANIVAGLCDTSFDAPRAEIVTNMLVYLKKHQQAYMVEKGEFASRQQWDDMIGVSVEVKK
jgi:hypothetical protein